MLLKILIVLFSIGIGNGYKFNDCYSCTKRIGFRWCLETNDCISLLDDNCDTLIRLPLNCPSDKLVEYNDTFFREQVVAYWMAAASDLPFFCLANNVPTMKVHKMRLTECSRYNTPNVRCGAFTAVDETQNAILLAIRGAITTEQQEEKNFLFKTFGTVEFIYGRVSAPFHDYWTSLYEGGIKKDLIELKKLHPNFKLWITGHSTGGAIAYLAAVEIVHDRIFKPDNMKIAVGGAPRAGDYDFAEYYSNTFHDSVNVIHANDYAARDMEVDLVHNVYLYHPKFKVWYKDGMQLGNGYEICPFADRPFCNTTEPEMSADDHLNYFDLDLPNWGKNLCSANRKRYRPVKTENANNSNEEQCLKCLDGTDNRWCLETNSCDSPNEECELAVKMQLNCPSDKLVEYNDTFFRQQVVTYLMAAPNFSPQLCLDNNVPTMKVYKVRLTACSKFETKNVECGGFTAVDETQKAILFAIRGAITKEQQDEQTLMFTVFGTVPFMYGRVVSPFFDYYKALYDAGVKEDLIELKKKHPTFRLWITGHSVGGAMAYLTAAQLIHDGIFKPDDVKVAVVGAPRVGDYEFALWYSRTFHDSVNVIHANDYAARDTPMDTVNNISLYHSKSKVWYNNDMKLGDTYEICPFADRPFCNTTEPEMSTWDHLNYFDLDLNKWGDDFCSSNRNASRPTPQKKE